MNVIDEVLKAENEATEKLKEASNKMAVRIEEAGSEQKEKLAVEETRLKEEEASELAGFVKTVEAKSAAIEEDTKKQVEEMEKKFNDNKAAVLTLIKESF